MSQYNASTARKTFPSGSTLARYLRVMTHTGVVVAGATDKELGVVMKAVTTSGDLADVLLACQQGTTPMVASAAITAGAKVYGAASGKISSTANSNFIGIALEAATADGDVIEVLRQAEESGDDGEVVITTNVRAANESGKTFYLALAAGFTSTLPAPFLGGRFCFVVQIAPTGAPYVITTTSSANILYGQMVERAGGAGVAGAARDTFNFVHTQSIIGDWVEFYSDGTNWYYHGMVDVSAGSTVAAT